MHIWSWDLYKFKNNYMQTSYTHKVVKVESQHFFKNKFSEFCLMFMSTSQPSYLCSLSLRYELTQTRSEVKAFEGEQHDKLKERIL